MLIMMIQSPSGVSVQPVKTRDHFASEINKMRELFELMDFHFIATVSCVDKDTGEVLELQEVRV